MSKKYGDSQFRAALAAGFTTPAAVARHVGCSASTARRRMAALEQAPDPVGVRVKLARIAGHIGVAVRMMDWAEGDDYVSACWSRGKRNPLRRVG